MAAQKIEIHLWTYTYICLILETLHDNNGHHNVMLISSIKVANIASGSIYHFILFITKIKQFIRPMASSHVWTESRKWSAQSKWVKWELYKWPRVIPIIQSVWLPLSSWLWWSVWSGWQQQNRITKSGNDRDDQQ